MKLTAKLSKANFSIIQLLKSSHSLNNRIDSWAGVPGCVVYYGTSYAGQPNWKDFIEDGSGTALPSLNNEGAAALIFFPIDNRFMVFSFGYGHLQLSGLGLERDFGLKVVLNSVHPNSIRSIDSTTLDTVIINKRTQLSKEKKITDFGFEINKDFLKHIAGKPTNTSFATSLAGGDSLNLNCDLLPANILQKVNDIYAFYNSTVYQTNYGWIDNIKNVKDKVIIGQLDSELLRAFNDLLQGNNNDIQLACPEIINFNFIDHFKIRGYRSNAEFPFIDIESFINDFNSNGTASLTQNNFESYRIESEDSNGNRLGNWLFYDWIIFSTEVNGKQYILTEGEWFEVSSDYFNLINNAFNTILNNPNEYTELTPTIHRTEEAYILNYRIRRGREKIFDRGLSYIYGGQNSIEICDIYTIEKEFIHIKEGGASSKLSHLFNQGFVSARLFLSEPAFRTDMSSKLRGNPQLISSIASPINTIDYTIAYRIIKSGSIFRLPFFSKIVLNEMRQKIILMGYKFRLEWVPKA